jgi:hypothetical protein
MAKGDTFKVGDGFRVRLSNDNILTCIVTSIGEKRERPLWPHRTTLHCIYLIKGSCARSWFWAEDPNVHPLSEGETDALYAHHALVTGELIDLSGEDQ